MTVTQLRPEPNRPEIGPRAALAEHQAIIADCQRRVAELSEPNPRLQVLADGRAVAEADVAAIKSAYTAEVGRWVQHGGVQPDPKTATLKAAQSRLDTVIAAEGAGLHVDADRVARLERARRALDEAIVHRRKLVAAVLFEELAPALYQRYAEQHVALNRTYWALHSLAVLQVDELRGLAPAITSNVYELPLATDLPLFNLPVHGEQASAQAGRRAVMEAVWKFVESLTADARAQFVAPGDPDAPLPNAA